MRPRRSVERFDDSRSKHTTLIHSIRLFASIETLVNSFDESPMIVEIDTYRPKSRSRRTNIDTSIAESGEDPSHQTISSPHPCQIPARLSIPKGRHYHQDFDWG
ncbi:hypothetical protein IFM89_029261 [Coptis chinensis]|uniref:Uncharacterized protein n=1 Tax=Coptis chinensis TaxID=261450 RepID=A0A835LC18_9MAGN|nr:hypothetical protein IFM89_029261 [Coptis chinensis]